MNEHREQCEERGRKAEERFARLLTNPVFAEREENIHEHWDVKDEKGNTYDVKAMKKYRSHNSDVTDRLHFIELKNVNGKTGWLYGRAKYIAFETRGWWIVVDRNQLAAFVNANVPKTKDRVAEPEPYKLYTREGRDDLMTILPTVDLLSIASQVLVKK